MYDIISQAFVTLFLTAYSILLIALGWWALRARLGPAVKNGIALVLTWAIATFHFPLWRSKRKSLGSAWDSRDGVNAPSSGYRLPLERSSLAACPEGNEQRKTLKEVA